MQGRQRSEARLNSYQSPESGVLDLKKGSAVDGRKGRDLAHLIL
jgi:hypothetical protein